MSDIAIRAQNLGKLYHIGERERYLALRDVLARSLRAPLRLWKERKAKASDTSTQLWAIKDVSFEIARGDVVGILGRNGAGKSTLLKVLARVTKPTRGFAEIHGRMGTLLEVGTGFHPELTGRENVFLSGAVLGMRKGEIQRKFDEIVSFSEVEKFIDTPLKHYSSGMQMRLAFAVAAHLEPEILLVDEVLAVGDVAFQKKCLGKMSEVSKGGRTILFVSHNMAAIATLCKTAILLDRGCVKTIAPSQEAIAAYLDDGMDRNTTLYDVRNAPRFSRDLRREVEFLSVELENADLKLVPAGADLSVRMTVRGNEAVDSFRFSLTIFRADGTPVGACFGPEVHSIKHDGVETYRLQLTNPALAPGSYHFGLSIGTGNERMGFYDFDVILDVLHFEVLPFQGTGGTAAEWAPTWGSIRFAEPVTAKCS